MRQEKDQQQFPPKIQSELPGIWDSVLPVKDYRQVLCYSNNTFIDLSFALHLVFSSH